MRKRIVILEYHKRERERLPSKTEQFKNIALGFAGIIASIAIPIVGLWLGYIQKDKEVLIADAEKNQEIQKSYVELGIRVLSDPPKPQSQPLREWAVKLINAHSAVALDGAAASAVVSDVPLTVPLPIRAAAQNCGGKERWGPKDGTDPQAPNIDLTNITPEAVTDLVTLHQPHLPADNTTRIVPDETHVYRVQAHLAKWKHESDGDYHMVLTDDTLNYTDESAHPPVPPAGHSFIGEVPDPSCFSGDDGSFGSQTPFADGISSARQAMDQRFPNADQSGKWNDGAGAPVEITGIGFFDRPHRQTGRAPNNIEIHPILSIRFLDQPNLNTSPTPTSTPHPR